MLAQRAQQLLKTITTEALKRITENKSNRDLPGQEALGGYNSVSFHVIEDKDEQKHFCTANRQMSKLSVAYSKPLPHAGGRGLSLPDQIKRAANARKLLKTKNLSSDFNHRVLFYDAKGERISHKAFGTLHNISAKGKHLKSEVMREIIGQIILAAYDLHSLNIAHRDFKQENFLCFYHDGSFVVKAIDHDAAIELQPGTGLPMGDQFLNYFGTLDLLAPEAKPAAPAAGDEKPAAPVARDEKPAARVAGDEKPVAPNQVDFKQINFKAIDCYALGIMITELIRDHCPELKNNPQLNQICTDLTCPDPRARLTVEAVMQAEFFGNTPHKRKVFFEQLRARAKKHELKIDNEAVGWVEQDDPYLLLDHSIKPVCRASQVAAQIAEQIADCQQEINNRSCFTPDRQISTVLAKFQRLNQTSKNFIQRTKVAEYKDDINQLKSAVRHETQQLFIQLISDKATLAILLKKAVEEAYADYVKINGLVDASGAPVTSYFSFFSLHRQQGRLQALNFKQKIERGATDDPKAIFDQIYTHYYDGPGRTFEKSFKTFLLNKLGNISDKSLEKWQEHCNRLDQTPAAPRAI